MQGLIKQFSINVPSTITWKWEGPRARYHHEIIRNGRYVSCFITDITASFIVNCVIVKNPSLVDLSNEALSLRVQYQLLEQFAKCPANDRLPNTHKIEVTEGLVLDVLEKLDFDHVYIERPRGRPVVGL